MQDKPIKPHDRANEPGKSKGLNPLRNMLRRVKVFHLKPVLRAGLRALRDPDRYAPPIPSKVKL